MYGGWRSQARCEELVFTTSVYKLAFSELLANKNIVAKLHHQQVNSAALLAPARKNGLSVLIEYNNVQAMY
jgi:hypothetical protein